MTHGRMHLLAGMCVAILAVAACACAQSPIINPSFESGLDGWVAYSYEALPYGQPGLPLVGCAGPSPCTFDVLYPSVVPDGARVCGAQSWGGSMNGGVYQTVHWLGGPAHVSVAGRAYSTKYPQMGGEPWDNGCRVRMGLITGEFASREDVSEWVAFPWSGAWAVRSVDIPGPGVYTIVIEAYQPDASVIMSTLWDKVVWTEIPPVEVTSGPTVTVPGDPAFPDTTAKIEWTTNVPCTSRVDYGRGADYTDFVESSQLVTEHIILLTGLAPSSTYHFAASSDAQGYAPWISDSIQIRMPIQFSGIVVSVTPDGLNTLVKWKTDVPTTSQVEYGATTDYGSWTEEDVTLSTEHSVIIAGLPEDSTYHFRVWGRNPAGYADAVSGDCMLHTLPSPRATLQNGSFEEPHGAVSPSLHPWVQYTTILGSSGYHPIDGIVGPYPTGGTAEWFAGVRAVDGSYFLGAAANSDFKNGGVFQRVLVPPNELRTLSARFSTYRLGGTNRDTRVRLGVDPDGGVDPQSPNVQWWSTFSPTNDSQWHPAAVTVRTGSTGVATVFLDIVQQWPIEWHVVGIDDAHFGPPAPMSIGQLRQSQAIGSAILEDKIVTYVGSTPTTYNGSGYTKAYLQESDRTAGIAVLFDQEKPNLPTVGSRATVTGSLVLKDMEAMVIAYSWDVDSGPYDLPRPVGMSHRSLGGIAPGQPTLYSHAGPCSVGLRVRVFGRVNWVDFEGAPFGEALVYIDDGSGILDHTPEAGLEPIHGIRAKLTGDWSRGIYQGDHIAVTGVLSIQQVDNDGWPNTGDEFYAYTILSGSADDWNALQTSGF